MTKRMIIMLILVGLLFGGIFGFQEFKSSMIQKYMASRGIPPQTVSTTSASAHPWQRSLEAVGSLQAVRGSDLAPEVSGLVAEINFKSGQEVKKGDMLIELDASADLAKLAALRATARTGQIHLQRDLAAVQGARRQQGDARYRQGQPEKRQGPGGRTKGHGRKKIYPSALYRPTRHPGGGYRSVSQCRRQDRHFAVAGPDLCRLLSAPTFAQRNSKGAEVQVISDAYAGKTFTGTISAINPKVDPDTRNVQVRATIKNPDHLLLPGMFVTTDIEVGEPKSEITLPQTAISFNPYGNLVYLVKKQGEGKNGKPQLVAEQKFVTTGATRGDQIAVLSGLSPEIPW